MQLRLKWQLARLVAVFAYGMLAAGIAEAVDIGATAPSLVLAQADSPKLEDYRGKVVYLDFWASWCGPCRQTFPWMNDMQKRYSDKGFQILAVNVDKKQADADAFLAKVPAEFKVLFDSAGKNPTLYGIVGMPTSFLIGRDGKVIMQHTSFHEADRETLEAQIRTALAVDAPKS
jgi:cytochrome c biogenesis protein CcmG/thiol:disulfide interchange protein DsbE